MVACGRRRDVEESWGEKLAQRSFETFSKSSSSRREGAPEVRRFGTTRDLDRNKKVFHPFLGITRRGTRKGLLLKDLPKADGGNFPDEVRPSRRSRRRCR